VDLLDSLVRTCCVAFLSALLASPRFILKFSTEQWMLRFGGAKLANLLVWSLWLCLNILLSGLSQSTYLASLMISGECTAGMLTLSANRGLVVSAIMIMLVPPAICFSLLGGSDAYLLTGFFGIMNLFLISMVNRVHQDHEQTQLNRELA
jgi:hypothetical protein